MTRLGNVVASESDKLRTLPAAALTVAATVLAATVIAGAVAAAADGRPASALDATLQALRFVQAGVVLLGILPVAHEYAGRQVRTTFAAVPRRGLLMTGKTLATLATVALTSAAVVGAGFAAATVVQRMLGIQLDVPATSDDPWRLAGAAVYLTLIGLLSYAVALLVRHLVPALVGMLSIVLIVSPLLAGLTEHARWLPDRAAAQLYAAVPDSTLSAAGGALVAFAWIALIAGTGWARLVRCDA